MSHPPIEESIAAMRTRRFVAACEPSATANERAGALRPWWLSEASTIGFTTI